MYFNIFHNLNAFFLEIITMTITNLFLQKFYVLAYLAQLIFQGSVLPGWNRAGRRRAATRSVHAYLVR